MANSKTIVLVGKGIRNEKIANAAITPGHLVQLMSTDKVRVHPTAGGHAQKAFAVEDDLQGRSYTTAYATGERVQYEVMERGARVNALIADGQTIAIGDPLESAGNGTLQKYVADTEGLGADSSGNVGSIVTNNIIGYAREAIDTSGSSAVDPASFRIDVEIA